ncbi:uncharacterized protein LOC108745195 [Agrilus planipennis]|uniref:Uncharacterized protein LOC108745195 n=1 Tax=Agrilus planipennis TaxID=224129 RepID=A0A1W4XWL2_AGRPL|nr:uncharacterized protein LOC108745195 [Agrilus planipennis]
MNIIIVTFLFLSVICVSNSSPISPRRVKYDEGNGKIKYDQRQEGQWNVRADLQNFVILIIPALSATPTAPPSSSPADIAALGLLELLSKAVPSKKRKYNVKKDGIEQHHEEDEEHAVIDTTDHFKEMKTAPYHVDIGKTIERLGKLGNGVITVNAEDSSEVHEVDIPITRSHGQRTRGLRRNMKAFVISVPVENAHAQLSKNGTIKKDKGFSEKKSQKKNLTENSKNEKIKGSEKDEDMLLLGAEYEQCGPDQKRDKDGICRS